MTPALKKLRYKPGMRVGVVGAPSGFERQVIAAKEITRAPARAKNLDLVQAFFTRRAHFVRDLPRLTKTLGDGGILWVCYPKAGALGTDWHRDIVRELAAEAGWQTVAAVAVDDVWSALRLKPSA